MGWCSAELEFNSMAGVSLMPAEIDQMNQELECNSRKVAEYEISISALRPSSCFGCC